MSRGGLFFLRISLVVIFTVLFGLLIRYQLQVYPRLEANYRSLLIVTDVMIVLGFILPFLAGPLERFFSRKG